MLSVKSFDRTSASMMTARSSWHNPEVSPSVLAHRTRNNIFVMDFERPSDIFDWRNPVMRNIFLKNHVKHIAITRAPWNGGTRIVGVPVNGDDNRKRIYASYLTDVGTKKKPKIIKVTNEIEDPFIDIRMTVDAREIDYDSTRSEVPIIPDYEVEIKQRRNGQRLLRFVYPLDIQEQIAALYVPPYPWGSRPDENSQNAI